MDAVVDNDVIVHNCKLLQANNDSTNSSSSRIDNDHNHTVIKELHIAPMLSVSTIEFHAFIRILTKRCILWTEMIVDETIYFQKQKQGKQQKTQSDSNGDSINTKIFNDDIIVNDDDDDDTNSTCNNWNVPLHILYPIHDKDHPIICQIGTIQTLWTRIATQCILHANYNHGEININLDCPSSRVQGKEFGAVLMLNTTKVITFIHAIQQQIPKHMCVSIKCRIGMIIDNDKNSSSSSSCDNMDTTTNRIIQTDYDWMVQFIKEISVVCQRFILHARPVILHGIEKNGNNDGKSNSNNTTISPAQNRCIPPLNYLWVYQLCNEFPNCDFIINGGITDLSTAKSICYGVKVSDHNNNNTLSSLTTNTDTINNYYHEHGVPCTKCKQQHPNGTVKYGSCIVPPIYPAPQNLRGCMIGRAAIDHPIQFAKADQFWYNDNETTFNNNNNINNKKATTRRQVLQQYCQFLDTLYPRRCCDIKNTVITSEVPAPNIDFTNPYCHICKDFRQSSFLCSNNDNFEDSASSSDDYREDSTASEPSSEHSSNGNKVMIATRIIDRSLKPILNIFHGCNGSKQFRQDCETLRRNTTIRNCGPAYIVYHAAIQQSIISDTILDESIV